MDIEALRDYCLSLSGTTEDIKWEDHLCFLIESKIYVMGSLEPPHSFSIKVDPDEFDALVARPGLSQPAYLAKRHWIYVDNLDVFTDAELKKRIAESRELVLRKLTKKVREKYI